MRIAIDAMGGDHAPDDIVAGVLRAKAEHPGAEFLLFGDGEKIRALLNGDTERLTVVPTTEVIETGEPPMDAIRKKKDSSLVKALASVKSGEAQAVVSAGSTGAVMAGALFGIGRIKGIQRPALAPLLPNFKGGHSMLIDSGANAECRPEYLVQFAQMGAAYMQAVEGVKEPVAALMNIGAEEEKGNELYKEVHARLAELNVPRFYGNLEPRYVLDGEADVLVADGFTGNMILKTMEGTVRFFTKSMKKQFMSSLRGKIGALILKKDFKTLIGSLDYTQYGGAPLLGVKGVVIKAHGSSDAMAFSRAISQAVLGVEQDLTARIENILQA